MARRDEGEFAAFAAARGPALRRTAYLICGDWERAADITQEALIRVYGAWPRLDPAGLHAYARRVTVNVAVDLSRRRSSRELPSPDLSERRPVDDPSGQVVDRAVLMAALADLPARQRACVVLRYYEDLSVEDVADALGCRPGTVKSQTARGLVALRTAYAQRDEDLVVPGPTVVTGAKEVAS